MGIEPPGLLQGGMEPELPIFGEARSAKVQTAWHDLNVSFPQRIVDDVLVLVDHDGTRRVHNIATSFALCVDQINSCQQQLFLQEGALVDFLLALVTLQNIQCRVACRQ